MQYCLIYNFLYDRTDTNTCEQKAARFMLIPLAISSALVILCTWMLIHVRGGVKWLFGGKGRYAGFDNIMELQPPRQELAKGSMPNNQRMVYS